MRVSYGGIFAHTHIVGHRLQSADEFLEQDSQYANDLPDFGQWQGKTSDRRCLLVGDSHYKDSRPG